MGRLASGSEKRQHERVAPEGVTIRIRFTDASALEEYYLRDISRGGIFLRARKLKPLRSQLQVALAMPDGTELMLRGEVVHLVQPEEATPARPSGMGVQFLDLTPEILQKIGAYVLQLKAQPTQSPTKAAAAAEPEAAVEVGIPVAAVRIRHQDGPWIRCLSAILSANGMAVETTNSLGVGMTFRIAIDAFGHQVVVPAVVGHCIPSKSAPTFAIKMHFVGLDHEQRKAVGALLRAAQSSKK